MSFETRSFRRPTCPLESNWTTEQTAKGSRGKKVGEHRIDSEFSLEVEIVPSAMKSLMDKKKPTLKGITRLSATFAGEGHFYRFAPRLGIEN